MGQSVELADVILWGRRIGTLIWKDNVGYFEYEKAFLSSGIEVSPLTMPLADTVYAFPGLNRLTFNGLPGLLADSLPDKFGNKLINQWLERQGRTAAQFSPVERLCYIGRRGMGALEFQPALREYEEQSVPLEIAQLVKLANRALSARSSLAVDLNGDDADKSMAMEHILSVGTSAGGARAKAVIAWDEQSNEVRSGQIKTEDRFSYWLLKFDGVEENRDHETLADPKGYSIVEYAYYLMATTAGVEMEECRLLQENGRCHFMTRRFDRGANGEKYHMQTLCGLAHYDFNDLGAYSYEQAIGVMRDLKLTQPEIEQFYRRMVFNVVARNQDDHTKNISFLMDKQGRWRLSPAYDVTYCYGSGWTAQHQMTINGKRDHFTRQDLLAVAAHADIRRTKALAILQEVVACVARWPEFAAAAGVPDYPAHVNSQTTWSKAIAQGHRLAWP